MYIFVEYASQFCCFFVNIFCATLKLFKIALAAIKAGREEGRSRVQGAGTAQSSCTSIFVVLQQDVTSRLSRIVCVCVCVGESNAMRANTAYA